MNKGIVKVKIENQDDLWYLNTIVDEGDIIKGQTERKIKIGSTDANMKVIKKTVFLSVIIEKIEFHKYTNHLRISGKINDGPEDIAKGTYHTFDLTDGDIFELNKKELLDYQKTKLREACENRPANILLVAVSRNIATFAVLKKYGYDILNNLHSDGTKKRFTENIADNFFEDIAKYISEYKSKNNVTSIVVGIINFWQSSLEKELSKLNIKPTYCHINNEGESAIKEILRKDEIRRSLKDEQTVDEINIVEDLLLEISKNGLYAYGLNEVKMNAESGTISKLIISDKFMIDKRIENKFHDIEEIMKITDRMKGTIHIVSYEHEGGKKLHNLGGIAGILRYKIN